MRLNARWLVAVSFALGALTGAVAMKKASSFSNSPSFGGCVPEEVRTDDEAAKEPCSEPQLDDADAEAGQGEPEIEAMDADAFARSEARAAESTVEDVVDEDGVSVAERIRRFREEHPEEWRAQQQRMEQLAARRKETRDHRLGFLEAVDPELIDQDSRDAHAAFAEVFAERNRLRDAISAARKAGADIPFEDRNRLSLLNREIREGALAERDVLLAAAVRSLGVEDETLVESARQMFREIVDATER